MTDIRCRVLAADLTTDYGLLDQAYDISWLDEALDVGAGELTIPHDAPSIVANQDLLSRDNVVIVHDDDKPEWDGHGWLVRRRQRTRGDVWDPVKVTGPGILELLRAALVEYARGIGVGIPSDERPFGWMAIDYDDTVEGWIAGATSGGTQGAPTFTGKTGYPESGWPVPEAHWLWPGPVSPNVNGGTGHNADDYWFRRDRLIGDYAGPAVLFVTADDRHTTYLNGQLVAEGNNWREYAEEEIELTGDDLLAVEVWNRPLDDITSNPASLLYAIATVDDEGEIDEVLFRSRPDRGRTNPFPGGPPGVTKGYILATLLDEAQAAGFLAPISRSFDAATDSNGIPWADEILWVCQVGNDSVLTVGERLRETGLDIWMTPDFTFHAAQHRGLIRADQADGQVEAFPLDAVHGLDTESEDELINGLLVRSDDAWFRVGNPPAGERRESYLTLGLQPTVASAIVLADHTLERGEQARQVVRFAAASGIYPVPYVDVGLGDEVLAPAVDPEEFFGDWRAGDCRLDTIAGKVTETGEVEFAYEVEVLFPGNLILAEDEVASANSVQQVALNSDNVSGGGFRLRWNGETTGTISWRTSLGSLKSDIESLPGIDEVTITNKVGGFGHTPPDGFQSADIEFSGPAVAGRPQPLFEFVDVTASTSSAPTVTELSSGAGFTVTLTTERGLGLEWEG